MEGFRVRKKVLIEGGKASALTRVAVALVKRL
jgi:hypothetical protein